MTTLHERISKVKNTNPYFSKDLKKAYAANKFIGRGSLVSSTHKYMTAAADLGNCGEYVSTDLIFISAEGDRRGRIPVDYEEIKKAVVAQSEFVTDDKYNRERSYNIGEREVSKFLEKNGYTDVGSGYWKKK